jgi:hypothetical protein
MQSYTEIADTTTLEGSRALLLSNDKTVMSQSAGTSFPTTNLQVGQPCYRSDESKLYILKSTGPDVWQLYFDFTKTNLQKEDADALYSVLAHNHTGTYQLLDATLTALAGLTIANGKIIYGTGTDAFALADSVAFGRSLLNAADAAALRALADAQQADADTAKTDIAQNWTLPQRSALTADNDGSFNLATKQSFSCTPTGPFTLTFTNHADGVNVVILLDNSGGHAISAAASTKISAALLSLISEAGVYRLTGTDNGTNMYIGEGPFA